MDPGRIGTCACTTGLVAHKTKFVSVEGAHWLSSRRGLDQDAVADIDKQEDQVRRIFVEQPMI